jgi:hypothetical protein
MRLESNPNGLSKATILIRRRANLVDAVAQHLLGPVALILICNPCHLIVDVDRITDHPCLPE